MMVRPNAEASRLRNIRADSHLWQLDRAPEQHSHQAAQNTVGSYVVATSSSTLSELPSLVGCHRIRIIAILFGCFGRWSLGRAWTMHGTSRRRRGGCAACWRDRACLSATPPCTSTRWTRSGYGLWRFTVIHHAATNHITVGSLHHQACRTGPVKSSQSGVRNHLDIKLPATSEIRDSPRACNGLFAASRKFLSELP